MNDQPQEPLLITAIRNRPSGHVDHRPFFPDGTALTGTSAVGLIDELDEWAAQIYEAAYDDGYNDRHANQGYFPSAQNTYRRA